jgi:MFS family permease
LVAEVWPEDKRTRAAGVLQSAWAAGFLIAAAVTLVMRDYGWRPIFVLGVAPAGLALCLRLWVKEPDRWIRVHERERQPGMCRVRKFAELFQPQLRRSTLVGSGLAFVAVFGLWGATNWTPTLVRSIPDLQGVQPATLTSYVSYATMMLNAGALVGYLGFGPLAERLGRRLAFAIMCIGSFVMLPVTFLTPRSYAHVLMLLPLLGLFNNGIFSGFPIYLAELYPTRIRATGAGFCFNVGRALASTGPLLTGVMVTALGGFGRAASAFAIIYLVGLLILPFAPETNGKPLPE